MGFNQQDYEDFSPLSTDYAKSRDALWAAVVSVAIVMAFVACLAVLS